MSIFKPNPKYVLSIAASNIVPPKSERAALVFQSGSKLHRMSDAIIRNNTWELVPKFPDEILWLFKLKEKALEQFKARLVPNGMNQVEGKD